MIVDKLKAYLNVERRVLSATLEESPETYSYISGRLYQIKDILNWLNDLPSCERIDEMLAKIKETKSESFYSYKGFNYEELLLLKDEMKS